MKRIAAVMCLIVVAAAPSWAGMTGFGPGRSLSPADALLEAKESKAPETIEQGSPTEVEWISIPGGKFMMGTRNRSGFFWDAEVIHEVTIKDFEMSKTEVTVEQYAKCVAKGSCTKPDNDEFCIRRKRHLAHFARYPVHCVNWQQARQYAKFAGARLPSEAEWEYAARSAGKDQLFPWGDAAPTPDKGAFNIGNTKPVCSKPAGNTAQGLCDMAGNVEEWTQDGYQGSYAGAPSDGSAWEGKGPLRVTRGGSIDTSDGIFLFVFNRNANDRRFRDPSLGFRLARSLSSEAP